MTKEEVIKALEDGEKLLNNHGTEIDFDWFFEGIDYSNWKIKPRTIIVNGFEVPEPLRVEPEYGEFVWVICNEGPYGCDFGLNYKIEFENGAIHSTKEAAQTHYDAIWSSSRLK